VNDAEEERRRIVHDLANAILVVQGNLDLLRLKLRPGEGIRRHLDLAMEAAETCRLLTDRLCSELREKS
jgi:hypothetical protein